MPADTINRETVRDAFAALLETALTGSGKPVYAVYNYLKGVITTDDGSPLVMVTSGGTARQRAGIGDTRWNSYFVLEIFTFVRDADAAIGWTEQNVEDALDSIDKAIADAVADNRVNANWNNIAFALDPAAIPEPSEIFTDTQKGFQVEMRRVYIQKMDT
jgi:hypothetical protein